MIKIMIHLFSNNDHAEPPITFMDIIITAKIILELGAIITMSNRLQRQLQDCNHQQKDTKIQFKLHQQKESDVLKENMFHPEPTTS